MVTISRALARVGEAVAEPEPESELWTDDHTLAVWVTHQEYSRTETLGNWRPCHF